MIIIHLLPPPALNVNKNITSPPFRSPDNPSLTSPACPVRNSGKHSKRYPIVTSDPCSIGAYLARCRVQSCPIYRRTGNYSTTFCRRGKATMLAPNQVTLKFLSVRKKNRYQDNPHAGPRDRPSSMFVCVFCWLCLSSFV